MSEPKIPIGSFSGWLLFRCISLFSLIGGLVLILANVHPLEFGFFCMGMFVALVGLASAHDQIYGVADEHGIHYRQYFASRSLKWEDIATISWAHAALVYFHLKGRGRSHKTLTAQSLQNRSWAELLSEEPEVIRWLTLVKPAAADGIQIRYPQATLAPPFRWNPFKASRIAQFIFVLAVIILIFSMIYARR
jgi:hypothetical protein